MPVTTQRWYCGAEGCEASTYGPYGDRWVRVAGGGMLCPLHWTPSPGATGYDGREFWIAEGRRREQYDAQSEEGHQRAADWEKGYQAGLTAAGRFLPGERDPDPVYAATLASALREAHGSERAANKRAALIAAAAYMGPVVAESMREEDANNSGALASHASIPAIAEQLLQWLEASE